jgi:small subunit ribosomal protein S21
MIIIDVKKSGGLDRALKKYKYKVTKTKMVEELRERKEFKKKSVERRDEIKKATYIQKKRQEELG